MKKIYMILAAMSLLSLSLNAQVILERTAQTDPNAPASFQAINRAPQKIDLPSGQHLVGPYTTDAFDTNGAGMPDYTGKQLIGVMLEPADFEQYLGCNVVAFRAAYTQENDVYDYFIYQMKLNEDSTYTMGAKQMLTPEYNYSQYKRYDGGSWYIENVTDPMVLHLDEGYNRLLIGYEYRQYSSTDYSYPIGINTQSTGHHHYNYDYSYNDWYTVNMSGDLAMQLIVESPDKSTPPTIHYSYDQEAQSVTIWLEGEGEMHMYINGAEVSFPITLGCSSEERIVTVTGTAQQEGLAVSDPALQNITIPQATVEMTADPSITSSVGDINVKVNGIGDGEVHMYVGSQEVTNPYYLERLEEDYDVVVTVTAQEEGKGMSMTTQTIHVPARGTIDLTGWTQLPGTYTQNEVINWGKSIMFIDRFTASTATNSHPRKYDYILQEVKAPGDTTAKKTNTQIVPVMHTGGTINGYYTENDVINDKDRHIELNLMNADFQMDLERNGDIYFYTMDRSKNSMAEADYIELTKPQHNLDNTYTEMGSYYHEMPMTFDPGIKHRLDTVQAIYHKGDYGVNYMSYVPIVWTFGNLPSNLRVDGGTNSYGSPIWQTGVGKVVINANQSEIQRQQGGWNTWTYQDNGVTKNACTYRAQISAHGYLPQDGNSDVNVEYEPYLFRIWVHSDSLRNYSKNPTTGRLEDNGAYGDTIMWLADVPCELIDEVNGIYNQDLNYGDVGQQTSYDNQLIFGAGAMDKPEILVRFYYRTKVKDIPENPTDPTDEPTTLREPTREVDQYGRYYAVEDGYSDNPSTGVDEYRYVGEVVEQMYYNVQGMQSETPFSGINIVVTRYSDGTTTTTKVVR